MANQMAKRMDTASTVGELLTKHIGDLKSALPQHLRPERMLRIALTTIRRSADLQKCTTQSLVSCIVQSGYLGLEIGDGLGHAYLVPYNDNKAGTTECTLQLGYKGLIDLAFRSGKVSDVYAYVVREGDAFRCTLGTKREIVHVPSDAPATERAITRAYAVAIMPGGGMSFEAMGIDEIEEIRSMSRAKNSNFWTRHYARMCRKTVLRRLLNGGSVPCSAELARAVELDDAVETGREQIFDADVDAFAALAADTAPTKTRALKDRLAKASNGGDAKHDAVDAETVTDPEMAEQKNGGCSDVE